MSNEITIKLLDHAYLPAVIDLNISIFAPQTESQKKYHDPMVWAQYLEAGGFLLGAFNDTQLIGFQLTRRDSPTTLHLWLGGVSSEYRGRGIMSSLLAETEKRAQDAGYTELTVNTYPDKFPAMCQLLPHRGFSVMREEDVWKEGRQMNKLFFRKSLQRE